ncbi:MAG TPA: glutathione S-transferase [Burkholderiales bacterium]
MLKLCGFPISNYYNKVKLALLEKGIPFEEERCMTGKEAIDAGSPMGKVPFLRTERGIVCESQAICEYLEELQPEPRLYPADRFERAKCRELIQYLELYLEWPARRLYPEVYFGGKVSEEVKQSVRAELERGIAALAHAAKFSPWIAGAGFSYADCAAYAHLPLVSQCTKKMYGEDILARIPACAEYLERLRARPHAKKVNEDRKADIERSMAAQRKNYTG